MQRALRLVVCISFLASIAVTCLPKWPMPTLIVSIRVIHSDREMIAEARKVHELEVFQAQTMARSGFRKWREACVRHILTNMKDKDVALASLRKHLDNESPTKLASTKDGESIIVPCRVELIERNKKQAWLIINCWEITTMIERKNGRLSHYSINVIDANTGAILASDSCM